MNVFVNRPNEGETIDIWGSIYRFKALGEQTENAYTLVEVHGRSGFETPLHSHSNEEEGFYVLEGEVTLILGDEPVSGPAGTFGFAPRGTPHGFRFGSDAKILLLISPGASGHEAMFRDVGEPTSGTAQPSEPALPSDPERVGEIARRHGTSVLGPLP
jgi:quercetin dioxygenase-like cupin family protein